jgi:hypothetical protein
MNYPNEKSSLLEKNFGGKKAHSGEKLQMLTLKDIPLEVRREEAKKPLFLSRYE